MSGTTIAEWLLPSPPGADTSTTAASPAITDVKDSDLLYRIVR